MQDVQIAEMIKQLGCVRGQIVTDWIPIKKLGSGAYGTVYEACKTEAEVKNSRYVLKVQKVGKTKEQL